MMLSVSANFLINVLSMLCWLLRQRMNASFVVLEPVIELKSLTKSTDMLEGTVLL